MTIPLHLQRREASEDVDGNVEGQETLVTNLEPLRLALDAQAALTLSDAVAEHVEAQPCPGQQDLQPALKHAGGVTANPTPSPPAHMSLFCCIRGWFGGG
jgi:hypothetical protein